MKFRNPFSTMSYNEPTMHDYTYDLSCEPQEFHFEIKRFVDFVAFVTLIIEIAKDTDLAQGELLEKMNTRLKESNVATESAIKADTQPA